MVMMVNTTVAAFSKTVNNLHNYVTTPQKVLLMNFLIVLQDFSILRIYNKKRSSVCLPSMILFILQYLPVHCTYPLFPHSKGIPIAVHTMRAYGACTAMTGGEWLASCIWSMYRNDWR